jgi:PLP dependent protein
MSGPDVNVDEVVRRLAEVHDRIRAAGGHDVEVLAVTKGFGADAVDAAAAAGCRAIGENYAQELLTKRASLDRHRDRLEVHFIGRLQSNKVRALAGVVDRYSTVDRESLVREIARRDPGARILVQVDTTATPDKGGCAPAVAADLVRRARDAGLAVEGLMTVGPTDGGPAAAEPGFRMVRALVDELGLEVCSMGMSADLEVAVAAGSTEVRLGTALFGQRPPRA